MYITAKHIKAARLWLDWDQKTLARKAEVSLPTIQRMEGSEDLVRGTYESVAKVRRALENAGILFIFEEGGGPGVRLRNAPLRVAPSYESQNGNMIYKEARYLGQDFRIVLAAETMEELDLRHFDEVDHKSPLERHRARVAAAAQRAIDGGAWFVDGVLRLSVEDFA